MVSSYLNIMFYCSVRVGELLTSRGQTHNFAVNSFHITKKHFRHATLC